MKLYCGYEVLIFMLVFKFASSNNGDRTWKNVQPTGCHNGNAGESSCCSNSNQCLAGEGDCDDNNDCIGNLQCGQNNCDKELGFNSDSDCCYDPNGKLFLKVG